MYSMYKILNMAVVNPTMRVAHSSLMIVTSVSKVNPFKLVSVLLL